MSKKNKNQKKPEAQPEPTPAPEQPIEQQEEDGGLQFKTKQEIYTFLRQSGVQFKRLNKKAREAVEAGQRENPNDKHLAVKVMELEVLTDIRDLMLVMVQAQFPPDALMDEEEGDEQDGDLSNGNTEENSGTESTGTESTEQ